MERCQNCRACLQYCPTGAIAADRVLPHADRCLRGIVEYNFFRMRLTADALVSFTYIPGTVFYVGYGSDFERQEWNGGENVTSDRFRETKRGSFFKATDL